MGLRAELDALRAEIDSLRKRKEPEPPPTEEPAGDHIAELNRLVKAMLDEAETAVGDHPVATVAGAMALALWCAGCSNQGQSREPPMRKGVSGRLRWRKRRVSDRCER